METQRYYDDSNTAMSRIICLRHGEVSASPGSWLKTGGVCPFCWIEKERDA